MKNLIILIFIGTIFTSCNETKEIKGFGLVEMTAKEFKQHYDNGGVKVIDVRTAGEFKNGHIKGAINLNIADPKFKEHLEKLDKNELYLMHCAVGGRSRGAFKTFKAMGFKNVGHLTKGIMEWQREGFEVVK